MWPRVQSCSAETGDWISRYLLPSHQALREPLSQGRSVMAIAAPGPSWHKALLLWPASCPCDAIEPDAPCNIAPAGGVYRRPAMCRSHPLKCPDNNRRLCSELKMYISVFACISHSDPARYDPFPRDVWNIKEFQIFPSTGVVTQKPGGWGWMGADADDSGSPECVLTSDPRPRREADLPDQTRLQNTCDLWRRGQVTVKLRDLTSIIELEAPAAPGWTITVSSLSFYTNSHATEPGQLM